MLRHHFQLQEFGPFHSHGICTGDHVGIRRHMWESNSVARVVPPKPSKLPNISGRLPVDLGESLRPKSQSQLSKSWGHHRQRHSHSVQTQFVCQSRDTCRKSFVPSLALATVNLSKHTRRHKVRVIKSFLTGWSVDTSKESLQCKQPKENIVRSVFRLESFRRNSSFVFVKWRVHVVP